MKEAEEERKQNESVQEKNVSADDPKSKLKTKKEQKSNSVKAVKKSTDANYNRRMEGTQTKLKFKHEEKEEDSLLAERRKEKAHNRTYCADWLAKLMLLTLTLFVILKQMELHKNRILSKKIEMILIFCSM